MPDVELELNYDDAASIPEGFKGLFDEKDGKFVLAGVNGLKTINDVNSVQEALRKEREDHNAAKAALKSWDGLKPDEVRTILDEVPTLRAAAEGKLDDDKIATLVDGKVTQKTAPLERQIGTLTTERDDALKQVNVLTEQINRRDMNEAVGSMAREMKVVDSAIEDVQMVAAAYLEKNDQGQFVVKADAQGVTAGTDIKQFLKDMQSKRPHWWPQTQGGGAGTLGDFGGDANPFSNKGWNMTAQSKIVSEKGMEFATKLAKAAGTTVGGLKPPA